MTEELTSSELVYDGDLLRVRRERWRDRRGREHLREVVGHPGSVVVVAVTRAGEVVLVCQFRQAARRLSWEVPAGTLHPGEDPGVAVARELREETGYSAGRWRRGPSLSPSPGVLDEVMHLFLAEELEAGASDPEEDEDLEARAFSPAAIEAMVAAGEIFDMKTLLGVRLFTAGWPEPTSHAQPLG